MFIAHDVEINKNGELYKVSDNPITGQKLEVVEFDVQGSEKELDFNEIERINGRFLNSSVERYKKRRWFFVIVLVKLHMHLT